MAVKVSERLEYCKTQEDATLFNDQFCSIIIDGANQSAFELPHYVSQTKDVRGEGNEGKTSRVAGKWETKQVIIFHHGEGARDGCQSYCRGSTQVYH